MRLKWSCVPLLFPLILLQFTHWRNILPILSPFCFSPRLFTVSYTIKHCGRGLYSLYYLFITVPNNWLTIDFFYNKTKVMKCFKICIESARCRNVTLPILYLLLKCVSARDRRRRRHRVQNTSQYKVAAALSTLTHFDTC